MANKKPITERRLNALYNHVNTSNSRTRQDILDFLLATISHRQVKELVERFNIKVEGK